MPQGVPHLLVRSVGNLPVPIADFPQEQRGCLNDVWVITILDAGEHLQARLFQREDVQPLSEASEAFVSLAMRPSLEPVTNMAAAVRHQRNETGTIIGGRIGTGRGRGTRGTLMSGSGMQGNTPPDPSGTGAIRTLWKYLISAPK